MSETKTHSGGCHCGRVRFCKVCGIKPFARGTAHDGSATIAINARCLDGVDLDTLTVHKHDGRHD